jgi:hypothetical protein
MKKFFLLAVLSFMVHASIAQNKTNVYTGFPSLIWPKLYDIRYEKATDKLGEYDKPIFSAATKALNGKMVTLPGYMVPFEKGTKGNVFMLSSLPLNACFFCGVGGPETVVQIQLKQPISYNEKPIEVKGILRLNDTNTDKMIYTIEQAEYLGEYDF